MLKLNEIDSFDDYLEEIWISKVRLPEIVIILMGVRHAQQMQHLVLFSTEIN